MAPSSDAPPFLITLASACEHSAGTCGLPPSRSSKKAVGESCSGHAKPATHAETPEWRGVRELGVLRRGEYVAPLTCSREVSECLSGRTAINGVTAASNAEHIVYARKERPRRLVQDSRYSETIFSHAP